MVISLQQPRPLRTAERVHLASPVVVSAQARDLEPWLARRPGYAGGPRMTSPADPALETALDALFTAPFPDFVEERKRLVVGLRTSGHKAAATALAKVNRPTLASWAINQLVRRAPVEVSAMFATAARVRLGDFAATGEHRQTIARLSALATELLREHAQPTSEATLRRITTSLQALSAYGDFAPDLPGRMIADRDPPGFDSMALADGSAGAALPLSLPTLSATGATSTATAATAATVAAATAPMPAVEARPLAAPPRPAPVLRLVPPPVPEEPAPPVDAKADARADAKADARADAKADAKAAIDAEAEEARKARAKAEAKADADAAAAQAAADAEAAEAAAAADRAVAEAAAALAAAQAAARAAAARVHLARQRAVLEDVRTRQRRAASAIFDHEQAIALMQRELDQRQAQLDAARRDAASLQAELERLTAELAALEAPS
jgi:hypothetical protein